MAIACVVSSRNGAHAKTLGAWLPSCTTPVKARWSEGKKTIFTLFMGSAACAPLGRPARSKSWAIFGASSMIGGNFKSGCISYRISPCEVKMHTVDSGKAVRMLHNVPPHGPEEQRLYHLEATCQLRRRERVACKFKLDARRANAAAKSKLHSCRFAACKHVNDPVIHP